MKRDLIKIILGLFIATEMFAYRAGDTVKSEFFENNNIPKDKVVIVDFFASWCVSCEKELPLINKIHAEKLENIEIIGVDTDEDVSEGKEFQKKLNLGFKVINDPTYKIVNEFSPIGMPALYYIKNEKVVKVIFGAVDNIDEIIKKDLKDL